MVYNNVQIPNIIKFYYLKSCVKDEAAEVIASIESSSENYTIAWRLSTDRYDNRKFIVENHFKALFNLPIISIKFSVPSLLGNVQTHMRALHVQEQPVDQWDLMIIQSTEEKQNNYHCDKWKGFTGNFDVPKLKTMISFLERSAQIDVTVLLLHSTRAYFASLSNPKSNQLSNFSKNEQTRRYCPVCKGDHAIYTCSQFLNIFLQN